MTKRMSFTPATLLGLSVLAGRAIGTPAAGDSYLSYSGTASEPHSMTFLYGEQHALAFRDGRLAERVVLYTCRDGSPFARKTVAYENPLAPNFLLEDSSNSSRAGVHPDGGERRVFFRGDGAEEERTGPLPSVRGLVADSGFDQFIRGNWPALMVGTPLELHFLVPSRLDDMRFQLQHQGSETLDGTAVEVFRLKLVGILGWVLPAIDVYYGADDHVLRRYDGPSDLRDAAGNNYRAQILFHEADRAVSDAQLFAEARRARLAPCT
ncbi:MAG: hypothetical protein ABJC66_13640 [Gammaproteobacteria bacterium]